MNRFGRSTSHHSARASAMVLRGVRGEPRVDLDRDPAVDAAGGVVDRAEHVARPADVVGGDARATASSTADSAQREVARAGRRRRRRCASACAKIVGLEVTPTTCRSLISSARLPVVSRSRLMSSSQTDTPAADSSPRIVVVPVRSWVLLRFRCSARSIVTARSARPPASPGQAARARRRHPLRGEAELLVQRLVGGGGAEVLEADALARVADELPPAQRDAGLDADPGPDRGGSTSSW